MKILPKSPDDRRVITEANRRYANERELPAREVPAVAASSRTGRATKKLTRKGARQSQPSRSSIPAYHALSLRSTRGFSPRRRVLSALCTNASRVLRLKPPHAALQRSPRVHCLTSRVPLTSRVSVILVFP